MLFTAEHVRSHFVEIEDIAEPVAQCRIGPRRVVAPRGFNTVIARDHFLDRGKNLFDRGFTNLPHALFVPAQRFIITLWTNPVKPNRHPDAIIMATGV
jgi:hypothetical protein